MFPARDGGAAVAPPAPPPRKPAPWWRTRKVIAVPGAVVLVLIALSQLGPREGTGVRPSQSAVVALTDDHGNTAQTGTLVTVPATQNGTIDPASDVDVFNFQARAGQDLAIELRLGTLADGGINLLGTTGEQLAGENAVGTSKVATVSYKTKDAGVYHVVVHGVRNATGTYQLVITAR
jgi:hypothetical protein